MFQKYFEFLNCSLTLSLKILFTLKIVYENANHLIQRRIHIELELINQYSFENIKNWFCKILNNIYILLIIVNMF